MPSVALAVCRWLIPRTGKAHARLGCSSVGSGQWSRAGDADPCPAKRWQKVQGMTSADTISSLMIDSDMGPKDRGTCMPATAIASSSGRFTVWLGEMLAGTDRSNDETLSRVWRGKKTQRGPLFLTLAYRLSQAV